MKTTTWIQRNAPDLRGKTIAVTGTTGGIGRALCRHLAACGADLILLDRNQKRSECFRKELMEEFADRAVECIPVELSEIDSVKRACEELKRREIDVFLHNAGAYSIPRKTCSTGFDNVFQINFVSPYYMIRELLPTLRARRGHVEVMGSIAHRYSRTDDRDVDFSTRKRASLVYGNSKRYLMFSLYELLRGEREITASVVHPGITFTNITAHYPKLIFALIKYPMKLLFPSPRRAALSAVAGISTPCGYHEWIGPRVLEIWGLPKKSRLYSVSEEESHRIGAEAERIYQSL